MEWFLSLCADHQGAIVLGLIALITFVVSYIKWWRIRDIEEESERARISANLLWTTLEETKKK